MNNLFYLNTTTGSPISPERYYSINSTNTPLRGFDDNGTESMLSKEEVLSRFNDALRSAMRAEQANTSDDATKLSFQLLFNGLFQAEGSWTGSFKSLWVLHFRPSCSVTQLASTQSFAFFARLLSLLPANTLKYYIGINNYGNWHIVLYTHSWDVIFNTMFPYLSYLQGDKFTAMGKLKDLFDLRFSTSFEDRLRAVWLAYNLTGVGAPRDVTLETKMAAMFPNVTDYSIPNFRKDYASNLVPMNFLFVLGFYLGDGGMYIHLRDEGSYISFVPQFKISQILTDSNLQVIKDIGDLLKSLGVVTQVGVNVNVCHVKVVGVINLTSLLSLIASHTDLLYWKTPQYNVVLRVMAMINLNVKGWLELWKEMVDTIYSIDNVRDNDASHWYRRFDSIYSDLVSDMPSKTTFVTTANHKVGPHKGEFKCWLVKLPKSLRLLPREKSFYPSTYGGREEALKAAIIYRDEMLSNYLSQYLIKYPM
uniref:Homing endonuclease LAGLIDADG domain-containing protein n=1 Tax=Tremella fuciformis TaxID=64657 RepID=A0A2H4QBZ6_9TREE|nr:hypothetical protein [Tremella fuciformis]ATX62108.1 hypothetical protein [Tremella fuciformis]